MSVEVEEAWRALGITPEDREENDDPDCETLAQCIAITIQYERDQAELARDAMKAASERADRLAARCLQFEAIGKRLADMLEESYAPDRASALIDEARAVLAKHPDGCGCHDCVGTEDPREVGYPR